MLALWAALALYSVSSFFFGTKGLLAMNSIIAERDRLQNNMEQLQKINKTLGGSMDALRYDPDVLSVYARELGYGKTDERFIRIVGLPGTVNNRVAAGNMVITAYPDGVEDKKLRMLALGFGFFVFLVLLLSPSKKNTSGKS